MVVPDTVNTHITKTYVKMIAVWVVNPYHSVEGVGKPSHGKPSRGKPSYQIVSIETVRVPSELKRNRILMKVCERTSMLESDEALHRALF